MENSDNFPPELPDVIYCRALRSGNRKQISGVHPDSPLIEQYKNTKMEYTKYVKAEK